MGKLDVLNEIRIASPCRADWSRMAGDERVRFCSECGKNVYNLSAMTADEAVAVVEESEWRACLRFYRRQDGTVLTSDCPIGLRRRLLRAAFGGLAAAVAIVAGRLARSGIGGGSPESVTGTPCPPSQPIGVTMGEIGPPPRPIMMGGLGLPTTVPPPADPPGEPNPPRDP